MLTPDAPRPKPVSLADLLAEQARRLPAAAALHCGSETLSWEALAAAAGRQAAAFCDVAPGTIVALAGRGRDLLMGLLAAHWRGHPFLPLDPDTADLHWPQLQAATGQPFWRIPALPAPLPNSIAPTTTAAEDAALVITTSGSEGLPKGVVLPHRALLAAAAASSTRIPLTNADTWLDCLPLTHIGGLAIFWRCFRAGAAVRLHERFSAEAVWADIRDGRASHVSLVPAMLAQMLDIAGKTPPPASLRCVLIGGAALSHQLWQRASATGWPLYVSYGMSESAAQIATLTPSEDWHEGLVGTALPNVELTIDADGRICLRGPQRMLGYLGEAPQDAGQWLTTGDLGRIDAAGRLTVIGRADDILVSGGQNVHPADIEAQLTHCPGVDDAAVTGRRDPIWGDVLTALVVGSAEVDSVAAWCRTSLPSSLRPRQIIRVASLPRNAMGKLERRRVAELLLEASR